MLSIAIQLQANEKFCAWILDHGCQIEDYIGNKETCTTAVHLAAINGRKDLLQLFLSNNKINIFGNVLKSDRLYC